MSIFNTFMELDIAVGYDYQLEEEKVLYPNDRAYPGCPANITINSVGFGSVDILSNLTPTEIEILEAEIMEMENTPPEER